MFSVFYVNLVVQVGLVVKYCYISNGIYESVERFIEPVKMSEFVENVYILYSYSA